MKIELEVSDKILEEDPGLGDYLNSLQLMLNRMIVSHYKYGAMDNHYPDSAQAIDSAMKRLDMYKKTGNTENCLDAANFLVIEHLFPSHEKSHFRAQSAAESPGIVYKE
jgi:hypothetical protein